MKKEIKMWKAWAMIMVYCFSIMGVIGTYSRYFFNVDTDEIVLFLATVTTMTLVAVFFVELVKLLIKILKTNRL